MNILLLLAARVAAGAAALAAVAVVAVLAGFVRLRVFPLLPDRP